MSSRFPCHPHSDTLPLRVCISPRESVFTPSKYAFTPSKSFSKSKTTHPNPEHFFGISNQQIHLNTRQPFNIHQHLFSSYSTYIQHSHQLFPFSFYLPKDFEFVRKYFVDLCQFKVFEGFLCSILLSSKI